MTNAREQLQKLAAERILVFDGGYGTAIQNYRLGEDDYRGSLDLTDDQKGNNDLLSLTRPDIIEAIHTSYLEAGADIIETNTFSSTVISQADYGCEHLVRDLNVKSAEIARAACDKAEAKDGRPRFVAGSVGPTNKTLSLSPDVNDPGFREIDYDYLKGVYRDQCEALIDGGVDFLLIETIFDTLNAKCAGMAAMEAAEASGRDVPLMISMTLTDLSGRNLSGHTVEAFWHAVRHLKPLTIGLNCSFGADQLRPHLAMLAKEADCLIMAYPNAGLPNDLGEYDEMPQETAELIGDWLKDRLVNIVGGCCGTTPDHIRAIADAVADQEPRKIPEITVRTRLSGLEPFTMAA
ncbi:MAG: 5-methyltetrahydrofolate--homocysteine methyltransferase [Sphingomonadales bacterium]|nr:5-methyltetrahydrofolate--homocysteine methyltransferase [Sphingomonadales bacterium]PIX67011.1 MAG: 5-methyltetrahydrofolate--homocysteine methyltransferase [Sphingomonadales bacterium CG_4_10_14_3_um_filter_58_15]NCO49469.1 5-methyltetrahydrofolate--homocysteine methyltransferase [Sphingomonadales bacterium]NCP01314.1 5-methyltetrahydrofolate--homocysteine methyltransferase [Sphingomonadales bacterium]NCP26630.1 5-methyltetrahydrofolate--homocysteine methyltransferase [Sphingomonadales bac